MKTMTINTYSILTFKITSLFKLVIKKLKDINLEFKDKNNSNMDLITTSSVYNHLRPEHYLSFMQKFIM